MDKSYAEQERDAVNLKLVEMKSAAESNVGKHYRRRRAELQERAENAVDLADILVDKHDGRVKTRRAKTEQNADGTAALTADTGYEQREQRRAERQQTRRPRVYQDEGQEPRNQTRRGFTPDVPSFMKKK